MNPSNGTFISMDKYQGTIHDPISLHKYLYANANPVMNSNPTGYITLSGLNTAMVMQGILSGMASGALISAGLNILRFLTRADTSEPFNFGSLASDMILGAIMGGFFGGSYAYASAIQSFAIFTTLGISSAGFSGLSLYGAYEEWENGNEIMALVNLGFATLGAFGSYKSFQGAARTPTGQKAMDWAKSVAKGTPNAERGLHTVEVNGKTVTMDNKTFDPNLIDKQGRTNIQRMEQGLAPIGTDGKSVNIHHIDQTNNGPVIEITASEHQQNYSSLHTNTGQTPSLIDRKSFNIWRKEYWKWRKNNLD